MHIDAISVGKNPPDDVNVIVEVPVDGRSIKYEMDMEAGALVVNRFLSTSMTYPGNYGFVPHTLSQDGDPIDVLIANTWPLVAGCVINVRPIGVLVMEDDGDKDEKIIAVPVAKLTRCYDKVENLHRPAGNLCEADRALLFALQRSGARQVGEDSQLAGRQCRKEDD
ncbi:inorganic pyrophosphatase [Rhizobium leguminosarum]